MESSLKLSHHNSNRPSKSLIFDRRYGWVFDEWKDPSDEAMEGGRGMFCVLPLAKALLKIASQTIDSAVISAVKVLENPNSVSPQVVQTNLNAQFNKFKSSMEKLGFNFLKHSKDFRSEFTPPNLNRGESAKTASRH